MRDNLELVDSNEVEGVICENVKNEDVQHILDFYIPQMKGIIKSMNGIGLSAPQVGIKEKFSIYYHPETKKENIIYNAFYVRDGDSKVKYEEGCLSYGLEKYVLIKRFKKIKLIYEEWNSDTKKLEKKTRRVKGFEAIILQHECDHFRGKTIFKRK